MGWGSVSFVVFSIIEGVGIFFIMLAIFRLKATKYLWQALFLILLMSLQSFVLRNELSLAPLVPVVNLLLFILLLNTVLEIPLLWAGIVSAIGYLVFAIVQTALVWLVFGSIEEAKSSLYNTYSAQTMTALVNIGLSLILTKFKIGFTFEFETLRLRREEAIVVALIAVFMVAFCFVMYLNDIWVNAVFFVVALLFLLRYALREERYYD